MTACKTCHYSANNWLGNARPLNNFLFVCVVGFKKTYYKKDWRIHKAISGTIQIWGSCQSGTYKWHETNIDLLMSQKTLTEKIFFQKILKIRNLQEGQQPYIKCKVNYI